MKDDDRLPYLRCPADEFGEAKEGMHRAQGSNRRGPNAPLTLAGADLMHHPIVHLIDDDVASRDSTELLLQTMGINVHVYASGIEFLGDVNPDEIRCLVLDVNMPGINGIDLLDRLRSDGITAPAIFVTALGYTAALRAAVLRTGAAVLLKPFQPGELVTGVKNMLD